MIKEYIEDQPDRRSCLDEQQNFWTLPVAMTLTSGQDQAP